MITFDQATKELAEIKNCPRCGSDDLIQINVPKTQPVSIGNLPYYKIELHCQECKRNDRLYKIKEIQYYI